MTFNNKLVLWLFLLGLAFSAGFVTEYLQVQEVEAELARTRGNLQGAREEAKSLEFRLQLADLRDLAALLYLEASRNNYDLAAGYSRRFFDSLETAADQAPEELQTALEDLRESRDAITVLLAQGSPAAAENVRQILIRIHEVTSARPQESGIPNR